MMEPDKPRTPLSYSVETKKEESDYLLSKKVKQTK